MSPTIITILAIISALIHMRAEYLGPDLHIYIFKPLTMALVITMAFLARKKEDNARYKSLVLVGLFFSVGGDILLMLPQDLFVFGLGSFLIAQLIYIVAFKPLRKSQVRPVVLLPFVAFGTLIYSILAPGLGAMRLPVIAYIVVILTMGWRAWNQWDQTRDKWAVFALVGATLFIISDSILALNKFGEPFIAARALTLSTYFSAQWLISYSIRRDT